MRVVFSVLIGASCVLAAARVAAHHSFAAEFDLNRPVKVTGSVTRFEWTNPHAWVFIEVTTEDGRKEAWAIELIGANGLLRRRWARDTVKIGDVISVEGYGARDGTNTGNASALTMVSTGREIYKSAAAPN